MKLDRLPWLGLAFTVLFAGVPGIVAQGLQSALSGHVIGPDSQPIANTCVSAKPIKGGNSLHAKTDSAGSFTIAPLPPGTYRVQGSCQEAAPGGVQVTLHAGENANVTISLSSTVAKETGQPQAVGMTDSKSVSDLPSNGRDLTQVATLQAGVSSVKTQPDAGNIDSGRGQRGFGAQVSISGSRPQQNNYILNGISINDYANSAPGSVLGLDLGADSVEKFTVSTSSFPAQFGRSSGGIVDVMTRSGGDAMHGSAYEFLRNSSLDARNYFDGAKPPFLRNQFGIAAGDGAFREKLHLFGNYEGLAQSLGVTYFDIVPSQLARSGNLASGPVQVDPQATRYLAFFPLPNRGSIGNGDTGNFAFAGQQVTRENYFTTRADLTLGRADSLNAAYVLDASHTDQPDSFDMRLNEITTKRQLVSVNELHSISQHLNNSLRFGVSRVAAELGLNPSALQSIAADKSYGFLQGLTSGGINIAGLTSFTGGQGAASPYHFHWTSIQLYEDVSYSRGKNSLRMGGAVERMRDNMLANSDPNGIFTFNSLTDFLTNRPYSLTMAIPGTSSPRDLRQTLFAAYAQDSRRVTDHITLDAGLRYEMATVPTEVSGKLSALRSVSDAHPHLGSPYFENPTLRNFEPRVGLAWDIFGKQKALVRSGFALLDVLPLPYQFELVATNVAPFFENGTPSNLPPLSFPYQAVQLAQNPSSLRYAYIEPKPRRNYVQIWNLSVETPLTKTASVLVGYVGSRGVHQPFRVDDANLVLPLETARGITWPTPIGSGTKVNPTTGRINYLAWIGDSVFHGLQTQIRANMRNRFDLQVSYAWSKSLDNGSSTIAGDQFANSISSLPWYNLRRNWGRSDFDVAQNLSVHATYDFSGPQTNSKLWLLKGWRLIGTYQASTGAPFTPIIAGDPLGTNSSDPFDVPDRITSGNCASPVNGHNAQAYIRMNCFQFPKQANVMGNLARNSVTGPGLSSLDGALFKESHLKRTSTSPTLQIRIELFNVLNHANFSPPLDHLAIFDATGAAVNGAGQIDTTATPSRQSQLGIKLSW